MFFPWTGSQADERSGERGNAAIGMALVAAALVTGYVASNMDEVTRMARGSRQDRYGETGADANLSALSLTKAIMQYNGALPASQRNTTQWNYFPYYYPDPYVRWDTDTVPGLVPIKTPPSGARWAVAGLNLAIPSSRSTNLSAAFMTNAFTSGTAPNPTSAFNTVVNGVTPRYANGPGYQRVSQFEVQTTASVPGTPDMPARTVRNVALVEVPLPPAPFCSVELDPAFDYSTPQIPDSVLRFRVRVWGVATRIRVNLNDAPIPVSSWPDYTPSVAERAALDSVRNVATGGVELTIPTTAVERVFVSDAYSTMTAKAYVEGPGGWYTCADANPVQVQNAVIGAWLTSAHMDGDSRITLKADTGRLRFIVLNDEFLAVEFRLFWRFRVGQTRSQNFGSYGSGSGNGLLMQTMLPGYWGLNTGSNPVELGGTSWSTEGDRDTDPIRSYMGGPVGKMQVEDGDHGEQGGWITNITVNWRLY